MAWNVTVSSFVVLLVLFSAILVLGKHRDLTQNSSTLAGIELPDHTSFNAVSSSASSGCSLPSSKSSKQRDPLMRKATLQEHESFDLDDDDEGGEEEGSGEGKSIGGVKETAKLHLKRWSTSPENDPEKSLIMRDFARVQTLYRRMTENKNQNIVSRLRNERILKENHERAGFRQSHPAASAPGPSRSAGLSEHLMATVGSGVSLGSGEYFMDVFIGTPPKHFSLILDTGSDLNWLQCVPCHDCFEQSGPYYDPTDSTSYRNISCRDTRCQLVSSPDPPKPCAAENQTCPYYYWYGDSSNTTGDFALETFTVNLTGPAGKAEYRRVESVMFGCGHWNRGLFHGAAGLLGLGRGPLSFSSQLQSLYGHSFSYCLVDRNSDSNVSSKLIFGEDKDLLRHPNLNFTSFVAGKENPVDTFYYVQIKSVVVGGEVLNIPQETWQLSSDGSGGTIIDSGTTLSYFAEPAYDIIKEAFLGKIKDYPLVEEVEFLHPCYNISGVKHVELPEFAINFADGAVWDFPVENYFITLIPDELICLAMMGTPRSALSIIGNYQQQNFHILYDTKRSRLGYAPMRCADV